ncbi:vWA domain-containing protein [Streptomyces sp. NBC_00572]|uniref:vWA domain-containing protein n=1 Tax=Streptomyces sp. NBC_00572 TaxID=2903664 RepID=UPI0022515C64|nr:vWA domain-containing protein [Streptomyces sp. NBC_00572]MCX4984109.1 VWA domain-containing protein [Streptomyces sp. NBC_00572]
MQWTNKGGVLLLAGALLALSGPLAATTASGAPGGPGANAFPRTAATQADPPEGPDPIDFAVVVDQSASLADKDLARETEAAALLVQGEISERSRAAVIGFGSSEKRGQSPVREVCPLTVADAAGRERLSDCVQELGRRDEARMGPGTDFPAAVRQAVTRLTGAGPGPGKGTGTGGTKEPAAPKVVFLLTDGKLDVADSPEYGTDRESRQSNGALRLTEELARARAAGVQIWPLGFGSEIDRAALTAMAQGGYRGACSEIPGSDPRMRVVDTSAEIDKALQETFAAARCARIAHGTVGKPPADLTVTIPPIATDGSLTVAKHDPKVQVTYFDPAGRKVPLRGEFDGSTFEVSGQNGPVEALRVKNPLPGAWRVHIEAPEGHRDREVAVRAIWQGRLQSAVVLDPASPRAGEQVKVEVQMQTRRGVVITDPRQLAGLSVAADLSGDGFRPVSFKLTDDGKAPDAKAGDVRFTGTLTIPASATGYLEIVTRMEAPGITSDRRPLRTRLAENAPLVTAAVTVDGATVHPGATVRGTLDVTNNDSAPRTLRLALANQTPGAELAVSPATVTAPPNSSTRIPFTVTLGKDTPFGALAGQVTVVDTADSDRPLRGAFLNVQVVEPPTWWERWWKAVAGGAALALVIGIFVVIWFMARRRSRDLTGFTLELRQGERSLDSLTVRRGQSPGGVFAFAVDEPYGTPPTLRRMPGGGSSAAHVLRRNGNGEMQLRSRGAGQVPVRTGEPVGLGDHELVVRGGRPTPTRGRGTPWLRRPRRTGPRPGPGGGGTGDTGSASGSFSGAGTEGSSGDASQYDGNF